MSTFASSHKPVTTTPPGNALHEAGPAEKKALEDHWADPGKKRRNTSQNGTAPDAPPSNQIRFQFASLHIAPAPATRVQAKRIGHTENDAFELEADRIAGQVTGMAPAPVPSRCTCGSCAQCRRSKAQPMEEKQSRQSNGIPEGNVEASLKVPDIDPVLQSAGMPLEPQTRNRMEQSFGHDFSRVRVHTGAAAERSATEMGALAWTFGNHIAFRNGLYAPETTRGKWLLAHELTHTVQQQQLPATTQPLGVSTPESKHEQDADTAAAAVIDGSRPQSFSTTPLPLIHRSFLSGLLDVVLFIPRLFGLEYFPAEDLRNYLQGLQQRRGPERGLFGDNKARACVAREQELGPYNTQTKTWLVEDMLDGYTSSADEGSIITLLRRSPSEKQQIVAAIGRQRLWSNFSGENRRIIEAMTLTAADAGDALVTRLRSLPLDEIQQYAANATEPAVQDAIRRAAALARITAPVPVAATVTPAGNANITINGVEVTFLPDAINPAQGNQAFTTSSFHFDQLQPVSITPQNANIPVGTIPSLSAQLTIQTIYPSEESKQGTSGYGAGTRPGDENTLQFHERAHGEGWITFLRNNPPPRFTGTSTMLPAQFNAAVAQFSTASDAYKRRAEIFALRAGDCVGTLPTDAQLSVTGFTVAICHQVGNATP